MKSELCYEIYRDFNDNLYYYRGINFCHAHFHQQLEIIYVLNGEIEVSINHKNKKLCKDQLAISDCFDTHAYRNNKEKSFVLIIPFQYLKKYTNFMLEKQLSTNFILDQQEAKQIKKAMEDIIQNMNENHILLSGYIQVLLGLILKFIPLIENEKKKHYDLIKKILIYIEENYNNAITLSSISKHFGYSKYYFSRIFNEFIQCNLNDYVNLVRTRHVKNLISDEGMFITDAAYKCGFTSIRTFYRTFKNIYGVTPKEYFKVHL